MTVHFNAKEFKEIIKSFTDLATHSAKDVAPITFEFDPFRIIMMTEHAFVVSQPNASFVPPVMEYSFNPKILLDLSYTDGEVILHWTSESSPLYLKNNYLRTALNVAVPMPEFEEIPGSMNSIELPVGVLHAVYKFLNIPLIFADMDKNTIPIWFKSNTEGNLEVSVDVGFSLARINTNIPVKLKKLDLKVPFYIIECLYAKSSLEDETPVKIGVHGLKSLFSNKITQIYSSSMNEDSSDFETVLKDFKSNVSCDFIPKKMLEAIKPLTGMLPKKDKGSIMTVKFENDILSMSTSHKDIGDGLVEFVDGISNIYQEKSIKVSSVRMVPQAFQEYTKLMKVDNASMFANNRVVFYKGNFNVGENSISIEYVFPTAG